MAASLQAFLVWQTNLFLFFPSFPVFFFSEYPGRKREGGSLLQPTHFDREEMMKSKKNAPSPSTAPIHTHEHSLSWDDPSFLPSFFSAPLCPHIRPRPPLSVIGPSLLFLFDRVLPASLPPSSWALCVSPPVDRLVRPRPSGLTPIVNVTGKGGNNEWSIGHLLRSLSFLCS